MKSGGIIEKSPDNKTIVNFKIRSEPFMYKQRSVVAYLSISLQKLAEAKGNYIPQDLRISYREHTS